MYVEHKPVALVQEIALNISLNGHLSFFVWGGGF